MKFCIAVCTNVSGALCWEAANLVRPLAGDAVLGHHRSVVLWPEL